MDWLVHGQCLLVFPSGVKAAIARVGSGTTCAALAPAIRPAATQHSYVDSFPSHTSTPRCFSVQALKLGSTPIRKRELGGIAPSALMAHSPKLLAPDARAAAAPTVSGWLGVAVH